MYIHVYMYFERELDLEFLAHVHVLDSLGMPHLLGVHPRLLWVQGAEFRVQGSGCRVQCAGWRVQGSGWRVEGSDRGIERPGRAGCETRRERGRANERTSERATEKDRGRERERAREREREGEREKEGGRGGGGGRARERGRARESAIGRERGTCISKRDLVMESLSSCILAMLSLCVVSTCDQIAVSQALDSCCRLPESADLWYTPRQLEKDDLILLHLGNCLLVRLLTFGV
jgi:hypothetical protein